HRLARDAVLLGESGDAPLSGGVGLAGLPHLRRVELRLVVASPLLGSHRDVSFRATGCCDCAPRPAPSLKTGRGVPLDPRRGSATTGGAAPPLNAWPGGAGAAWNPHGMGKCPAPLADP